MATKLSRLALKNDGSPLFGRCVRCTCFTAAPLKPGHGWCVGNITAYKEVTGKNFSAGAPEGPSFEVRKLDGCSCWSPAWTPPAAKPKRYLSAEEIDAIHKKYAGFRRIIIGERMHVFLPGDPTIDKKIKRALAAGKEVRENGVIQWIEFEACTPPDSPYGYVWDSTKKLIQGHRMHKVRTVVDGKTHVTQTDLGLAWMDFKKYNE